MLQKDDERYTYMVVAHLILSEAPHMRSCMHPRTKRATLMEKPNAYFMAGRPGGLVVTLEYQ